MALKTEEMWSASLEAFHWLKIRQGEHVNNITVQSATRGGTLVSEITKMFLPG